MNFNYNFYPANNIAKISPLPFRSANSYVTKPDYFENTGNSTCSDSETLTRLANSNLRIMSLLKENNLPLNINTNTLESLKKGHFANTRVLSAKIYSALPQELKSRVNLQDIQQASLLHDFGKILIPENILNKAGNLDEKEKKIMELHSVLGAELLNSCMKAGINLGLEDCTINENVIRLVKYHHQTPDKTGYPFAGDDFSYGIDSQILETADKYCALREKRAYKDSLSKEEALNIIHEDVQNGLICEEVFEALKSAC